MIFAVRANLKTSNAIHFAVIADSPHSAEAVAWEAIGNQGLSVVAENLETFLRSTSSGIAKLETIASSNCAQISAGPIHRQDLIERTSFARINIRGKTDNVWGLPHGAPVCVKLVGLAWNSYLERHENLYLIRNGEAHGIDACWLGHVYENALSDIHVQDESETTTS